MTPEAMQFLNRIEQRDADLRTATLDFSTAVPQMKCPPPMTGRMSSTEAQALVDLDYNGWWNV